MTFLHNLWYWLFPPKFNSLSEALRYLIEAERREKKR
jgi:hypothetical protein